MKPHIVEHRLQPVYDADSRVLILGTMPSPKSREAGFYYAHPQNRFWKLLACVFDEQAPATGEERRAFLGRHHIALWDVLSRCEIAGAGDASIRKPEANDMSLILEHAQIQKIFTTGTKAYALYQRLCMPKTGIEACPLPSPSPANCGATFDSLLEQYRTIARFTE